MSPLESDQILSDDVRELRSDIRSIAIDTAYMRATLDALHEAHKALAEKVAVGDVRVRKLELRSAGWGAVGGILTAAIGALASMIK